eukprot:TRINITY_DN8706_c0_g1_i2.p1 TRINITY_DN8706_c0_g1~~TRINITY_DN8706_c0_g1_i2.p1  ORF type:complete len:204 (-),score=46.93 TRINITY_DN8706_c0_g1_i2:123-734(-)
MAKVDFKVVLLGMNEVGKTCLIERYLHGRFRDDVTATVGAAFGAKKVVVGDSKITLGIWDTAGTERFESMTRSYYRGAKAALLCHDLTSSKSFEKVKAWADELKVTEKDCALYIVGTKADVILTGTTEQEPSRSEIQEYGASIGAKIFITSAKTGDGINEVFQTIAEDYQKAKQKGSTHQNLDNNVHLEGNPNTEPGLSFCQC